MIDCPLQAAQLSPIQLETGPEVAPLYFASQVPPSLSFEAQSLQWLSDAKVSR